jgi:hypothetical protein
VRCPRCGNENPGTNRFCGMCGTTLLPPPAVSQPAAEAPPATSPMPPRPATVPPASPRSTNELRPSSTENEPLISGPSFLGLNQPANPASSNKSSRRSSLSIDPNAAQSSRNLDYLLEDDEPRSSAAGKFILIVIALLLAVGLGYIRWKNQGLGWLGKSSSKPSAATESSDSSDSNASPSATTQNSPLPSTSANPTGTSPSASAPPALSQPVSTPPASSHPAPSDSVPPASTPSSVTNPSGDAANSTSPATTPPPAAAPSSTGSHDNAAGDNGKNAEAASPDTLPAEKPKPVIPTQAPKPAPKPVDPVTEAQKYLYGKGVKQDCDRGMRLLKPEADRSNPKAMTEMGALYSAGLCTPRDLPTSYRWFALALRKNPDDQALQGDLQKLWDEMTQPERQQAIRLSQ